MMAMLSTLKRYLSIYAALWKNSVTREMIFKSNFLLWIFVELLWFGLQLSLIGVLYLHTDHIGSWAKWISFCCCRSTHDLWFPSARWTWAGSSTPSPDWR